MTSYWLKRRRRVPLCTRICSCAPSECPGLWMVTSGYICSNHISEVLPGPMRNFIICEYSPVTGRCFSKRGYILLPPLSKSPTGKRKAVAIASSVSTRGLEDPDSSLDKAPFETPDNLDRSFNEIPRDFRSCLILLPIFNDNAAGLSRSESAIIASLPE